VTATRTLLELLKDHPGVRVVSPKQAEDEFSGLMAAKSSSVEADTVGGEAFAAYEVPRLEGTSFTHFLDGAQRSWPCLYVGLYQVRIAHTSAALVPRHERSMEQMMEESYRAGLEAFVPGEVDVPGLEDLSGLDGVRRVGITLDDTNVHAAEKTQNEVSRRREEREIESSQLFTEGWLLVDGGIGNLLKPADARQIVGVVKSHGRQYFKSPERAAIVVGLKVGERTTSFHRVEDPLQGAAAVSFYLRLKEGTYESPLYGIVRVEIPPTQPFVSRIDKIAAWLLNERDPSSLPDPRHDKLLYPIRLVEQHLKARMPSEAAIRALIGL
jgi:hypothetical protein